MKTTKPVLAFILLFAGICIQLNAATLTVTNSSDAGAGSLRAAVAAAAANDIIIFDISTVGVPIVLTTGEMVINKNLTIIGNGISNTIIDGNNASRIFNITQGDVSLQGITIQNGMVVPYLRGGGISSTGWGTINIYHCLFLSCTGDGGGIYTENGAMNITGCTFDGNHSSLDGGGIRILTGNVVIEGCTFTNNTSTFSGGAIRSRFDAIVTVKNSTLSGNTASMNGGGFDGTMNLINCTIANNSAHNGGGGKSSGVSISNCIFFNNTATVVGPDFEGAVISGGYNIIGNISGTSGFAPTDMVVNPLLGPLADNGGPTKTFALLCGSPAIDAADSTTTGNDQRGTAMFNGRKDIGAYEFEVTCPSLTASLTGADSTCAFEWETYWAPAGMTNYDWTVSGTDYTDYDVSVLMGGGGPNDRFIMLQWKTNGNHSVTVSYTNPNYPCCPVTPTSVTTYVNGAGFPFPSGPYEVCVNEIATYTITPYPGSTYQLSTPIPAANYNLISGGGPNEPSITIQWLTPGNQRLDLTITTPGCHKVRMASIEVFSNPISEITGDEEICSGASTILDAGSHSGYLWSTTETTQTISVNSSGTYNVTVSNADGCTASSSITITQTPPLVATGSGTNVTCFGGSNGTASVTVTGGPSTIIGLGPVGVPLPFQGILNGAGSVPISDTCDCPTGYVAVGHEGRIGASVDRFTLKCRQLLPNGTLGAALVNTCSNGTSIGGTAAGPFLSPTDQALVKLTVIECLFSAYYPSGINADSKSISEIYSGSGNTTGLTNIGGFVTNYTTPTLTPHPVTAPDGNVITGMITYEPSGSFGLMQGVQFRYAPIMDVPTPVEYLWSNGATTSSISNLTAGTYTVTVTKGECSTSGSYTVTGPTQPFTTTISGNLSICAGNSTTLDAGNFSSYNWSTGATTQTISVNTAATFTVTVTNANGCTKSASVTTTVDPIPSCIISGIETICAGASTQWCAPAGLLYNWSNGATTRCVTQSATGNYTVTTTDVKGCSSTCNKQLTVGSPIVVDAGPNKFIYRGYADSSCTTLQSTIGGGTPPLTRQWSAAGSSNLGSGSSLSVCGLTASKTYYLTVTDANGCNMKDSVRVCVFDVRCGSGNKKVTVCHGTGSVQNPFQTICITPADAKWHFMNHPGEKLGTCGMSKTCGFGTQRWGDEEMYEGGEEEMGLIAYPNPAQNEMNISFHSDVDGKYLLRLVDITGQILLTEMKDVSAGENKYTVNLQNFAPGIYLVLMQSGENIMQTRIIKE